MINRDEDARLLILSCSQRKRKEKHLLPAIERYDGPIHRITRMYLKNTEADSLSVWILSAVHALIPSNYPVADYDKKMTLKRATELQNDVEKQLEQILKQIACKQIMFCMSSTYLTACSNWLSLTETDTKISTTKGSLGKQCAMLYDWLFEAPPPIEASIKNDIIFRGKKLNLTKQEILDIAAINLQEDPIGAARFESWYVSIGNQKVAPKWLLSLITSIPVGQFRTADARRILTQLGIEVYRI